MKIARGDLGDLGDMRGAWRVRACGARLSVFASCFAWLAWGASVACASGCGGSGASGAPNDAAVDAMDAKIDGAGETGDDGAADGGDDTSGDDVGPSPGPTPPDPPLGCPTTLPSDTLASARAACTFVSGDPTAKSLGIPASVGMGLPIRHVIVFMRENRSFDHLLGKLSDHRPGVEVMPSSFANPDTAGTSVPAHHATTTCEPFDPDHQWDAMHNGVDGGKMDGFVKSASSSTGTDGHFAISYYTADDLPFDYWLAETWPVGDRHFASELSGTYPSRLFMLFGTNDGVKESGLTYPSGDAPSIFDRLDDAHYSWAEYTDGSVQSGALNWDHGHPGVHPIADLWTALDAGTLPNVAFVDGIDDVTDDHPNADLQQGEAFAKQLYDHAIHSPEWSRLAIVWTYDEGGGFADHVPPPSGCVARPGTPVDAMYTELGVRVPFGVVSPWARPNYVSHVVREHTSITRFIELLFDLPALTSRDANADALLDMFDFSSCTPPMLTPPTAPAAGTGGCH